MDLTPEDRKRIHREEKQRIASEDQARREAEARRLAHEREEAYWATVKLGKCPQCDSPRIREFQVNVGGGDNGAQEAACCIGCCLFWPLALLAPFLGKKPIIEMHRQCTICGYQWRI